MLNRNEKCVINTDLDGFLCGLLLHHFLDWEIVGFCNSRDTLWLDQSRVSSLKEVVFVDMFVAHKDIRCIDQHIVSCDLKHNALLKENKNKINPNIQRDRVFFGGTYYTKFPFGTFHFLVSMLEKQDINVKKHTYLKNKVEIKEKGNKSIRFVDLLLRADDTLNTTVNAYKENAKEWWSWLGDGELTQTFVKYCKAIESGEIPYNIPMMKREIGRLFRLTYGCDTEDGGYRTARAFGEEKIRRKAKKYLRDLASLSGWKMFPIADQYTIYIGDKSVEKLEIKDFDNFSKNSVYMSETVFSYAFISSYTAEDNFSFTGNMRKC